MHFQKPDKPGVWRHPRGTPVWFSLSGCWRLVMFCISCFFGVDTEYSMHWHWIGEIAALSLLPGAAEWFEEEGTRQQGCLMQEDRWCKGSILNRLQSHCHSAASQLCLGTASAGDCLEQCVMFWPHCVILWIYSFHLQGQLQLWTHHGLCFCVFT